MNTDEVDENTKAIDEYLANFFHNYIDKDTLLSIKQEIMDSPQFDIDKLYIDHETNPISNQNVHWSVASTIAMSHYEFGLEYTDEKKKILCQDNEYLNRLKRRCLQQCLTTYFRSNKEQIFNYSYCPILYSIHGVLNAIDAIFNPEDQTIYTKVKTNPKVKNFDFKINMYQKILNLCYSDLILIENGQYASAYSILRTLIETIFICYAVDNSKDGADEYKKFVNWQADFEKKGFPKEFNDMYDKKCLTNKNLSKGNYFDYGWLDKIETKADLNKIRYEFLDVVKCSNSLKASDQPFRTKWSNKYKNICQYVHGNYPIFAYSDIDFLILSECLGLLVLDFASEYKKSFYVKLSYGEDKTILLGTLTKRCNEITRIRKAYQKNHKQ